MKTAPTSVVSSELGFGLALEMQQCETLGAVGHSVFEAEGHSPGIFESIRASSQSDRQSVCAPILRVCHAQALLVRLELMYQIDAHVRKLEPQQFQQKGHSHAIFMRIRCAVYISSSLDFSQAARRSAEAQDMSEGVDGHENNRRLEPAVLSVKTLVYRFGGEVAVAGTVTEPST